MHDQRYNQRGVSAGKEDVHRAIRHLDKGLVPGSFCKVVADPLNPNSNHGLIMHADGAGTKSSLAYIYWKETGDISVWKGIAQDALVMNTDDLLCSGCVGPMVVSSTIGRNKGLIPGEVIEALIEGTRTLAEQWLEYGIELHLAGGETADLGDLVRTVHVDTTVVARMPISEVIDNHRIAPGHWVVGFESFGQALWEDRYNGGMGSNGLTSARHDVLHADYRTRYPESFDPALPIELVYAGSRHLTDSVVVEHPYAGRQDLTVGQLLLSPTRTYLPLGIKILRMFRPFISGMVHCSGGGQTKVLHFLQQGRVVKNNLFTIPPLFDLIQTESGTDWREMFRVFNMGHRLEVYFTDRKAAEECIALSEAHRIQARLVGLVEPSDAPEVRIEEGGRVHSYFS